ncbi:hypothetical protein DYB32_007928 [Aphanomyces invadans]|uniref:Uncharacterized protein n=1 Tax=Aphanomyces invadans TaxID=157072 RepID=A0A418AMQ4_9STRA|nr:hypothetical protein DYB32_007928 [Aphanomyces invadans]
MARRCCSYDADGSGYIELSEFKTLLTELGVSPTPDRVQAYLTEFDTNNDGKISFEEFKTWWNKDDVEYVLKRSPSSSTDTSVVCYRGPGTTTTIAGLTPNTRYVFRLRHVGSHATSGLSPALSVMTLPRLPSPVLDRAGLSCHGLILPTGRRDRSAVDKIKSEVALGSVWRRSLSCRVQMG